MKSIIIAVAWLITTVSMAQHYEPQILILAPNETRYDKKLGSELNRINNEIKKNSKASERQAYISSEEFKKQPENIQLMTRAEAKFLESMDFFKLTSHFAQQYLSYRFFERFPNQLILLSNNKLKGNLSELKEVAEENQVQYVLNFASIELFRLKGVAYARMRVQLYDRQTNTYLISKDYTGDWLNPGFEFSCTDKTINCTINNALSAALGEVIKAITGNSPTIQREKELSESREQVLAKHVSAPGDLEMVKTILSDNHAGIEQDHLYQVLFDDQKNKFVAFSVEQVSPQSFKEFVDRKKDKNVNIISDKDLKDEGFLNNVPQTYSFLVKGVNYNGNWYFEKSNVTYFESKSVEEGRKTFFNNLQGWNYFVDNTNRLNPGFWETGLFSKVRDLKQDPDWDKYGSSIWKTEEANNRPYIGIYEVVANVLRKKLLEENEKFEKEMKNNFFRPVYEKLKVDNPKQVARYSEHSLIYSVERNVVINPVLFTDEKEIKTLHYFVSIPNTREVYEWIYFHPQELKNSSLFGSTVVDQINTLTEWNFSYDNLNDIDFWNKYVLMKEGNFFRYLKKISP